jgi:uncharacterized membrane protein YadS
MYRKHRLPGVGPVNIAARTDMMVGHGRRLAPGVLACAVVGAAAAFLSEHYSAPVMLFALLLGMAMNFLSGDGPCAPGIEFTARQVLRIGIALLGLRITVAQVAALGWGSVGLVVACVVVTIVVSMAAARMLGFPARLGLLTGGATAICGASAGAEVLGVAVLHGQRRSLAMQGLLGLAAMWHREAGF